MAVIGIDLGTTYSCAAVWKDGTVEVIPNEQGNRTTPSYVSFTKTERLIGEVAKNNAQLNPKNTIFAAKRLIGRRYDDIGVQMDLKHLPFSVINDNGKPKITVEFKGKKKTFAPEEVSAMILFRMKQIAEAYLGKKVVDAVVTVPAYFNDAQRQATRTAGTIAGLNILRIINEPTAAALAYGLDRNLKGEKNILIYDLGGGTFDVSVLTISEGSVYEVKSTAGNTRLGGEDFDSRLVSYFSEDFSNKYNKDVLSDPKALRRLRTASEKAKRALTSATVAIVEIEALSDGIDYSGMLTRDLFEELCSDLFEDTLKSVHQALSGARMKRSDIHEVVLIGGSTRVPKIRSVVQDFFKGLPLTTAINPDEAVAYGAAMQAAILSINDNEKIKDLLLVDVVPLSLGVETVRGMMYKVIERNTPIPCRHTKDITTLEDYQSVMTVEVYEGERSLTKDNNLLGVFELTGIPPAPRGVPKVDVSFDVDVNGILTVSARDRSTGNTEGIVINNNCRLMKHEIDRMITDAEIFKEEDKENKLRLEARNQMESYIFEVRRTISDRGELLSVEESAFMKTECQEAVDWLDLNSDCLKEEYVRKMTELMHRWSSIMKKFYSDNWKHIAKRARSESYQHTNKEIYEPARIQDVHG